MNESKEMFGKLGNFEQFHLVDLESKLPLYYGYDKKGRLSLSFISDKYESNLTGTQVLDIVSGKNKSGLYQIFLSLNDNNYKSIFYALCDDIISSLNSAINPTIGFKVFIDRIRKWKRMFTSKSAFLDDKSIQGLYGELYFLDNFMFHKYGKEKAVKAWGGPLGMAKDFSIDLDWYEVKCMTSSSNKVTISSIQQLDSENPGHLVIVKVELVPEGFNNGIASLNDIFWKINKELSSLPETSDLFLQCVLKKGFQPDDYYNKFRFDVVGEDFYLVQKDFPRIQLPKGGEDSIGKVTYELMVNSLKNYLEGGK
ncbi:MAG: PD-(D/E)XK motif protein [Mollicutes bacterium]|nr:PD-(D/E)XK motif protein [Mollicutes bacterium]